MSLVDDLKFLHERPTTRHSCLMRTILQGLSSSDRVALEEVLTNTNISNAQISRTLIANGIMVKTGTIGKHRKQDCSCNVLER
jgi:hypothetical protein